jgi:hypothetical protein
MKKSLLACAPSGRSLILSFSICQLQAHPYELKKNERTPKNTYQIQSILTGLERKNLENHLRNFLKNSRPNRYIGGAGHQKAREYLEKTILTMDAQKTGKLTVQEFTPDVEFGKNFYLDDFNQKIIPNFPANDPTYKKWQGFTMEMVKEVQKLAKVTGKNFIWEKKGNKDPESVLVFTANYDSAVIDTKTLKIKPDADGPGADNNGTGVALMLAMIELFQTMDLPKTVRFVFLDYGELSYLGAHAYAESIVKEKKPLGILNFLMLGNDTKRDKEKKLGNMKVYMRKSDEAGFDQDSALSDLINSRGARINSQVKFTPMANGFDSYGHTFFWKLGIPSLVFTQDWEDDFNETRYHTSNDFLETLNLKTFNNSFEYLAGAIISWAFDINR